MIRPEDHFPESRKNNKTYLLQKLKNDKKENEIHYIQNSRHELSYIAKIIRDNLRIAAFHWTLKNLDDNINLRSFEKTDTQIIDDVAELTDNEIIYLFAKKSSIKAFVKNNLRITFYKNVKNLFKKNRYGESPYDNFKNNFNERQMKYYTEKLFTDAVYKYYTDLYDEYGVFDDDVLFLLENRIDSWNDDTQLGDRLLKYIETMIENEYMYEFFI